MNREIYEFLNRALVWLPAAVLLQFEATESRSK
jgi:hypothetical protein